jgi:hypothetical protein
VLFNKVYVLLAVFRKFIVISDTPDVAVPAVKYLENRLSLFKLLSGREVCCNLSVDFVAYAYRDFFKIAQYIKYSKGYICSALNTTAVF